MSIDEKPYNPLDYDNLGQSVADALLARVVVPLAPLAPFAGAGVYALYYTGDLELYAPLARRNQAGRFALPIYVGKAVPSGARKVWSWCRYWRDGAFQAPERACRFDRAGTRSHQRRFSLSIPGGRRYLDTARRVIAHRALSTALECPHRWVWQPRSGQRSIERATPALGHSA